MFTRITMSELSLNAWNTFLANSPNAHLLQTGEWGELKSAFGWEAARLVTDDCGVQILFRKLPLGFTLAYIPKPLSSVLRHSSLLKEVDRVCKSRRAVFLKIEPDEWESVLSANRSLETANSDDSIRRDFQHSQHNIQPPRTIVIDLCANEDEILARMKQKTRYNIRLAEKKGVTVRAWDDIPGFHEMLLATGERDVFGVHSLAYYRRAYDLFHQAGMVELLVAEHEGWPLAALMVFARGKRAWYMYGASTDRERNRMPTYLLQWEAMRWAKARGCEEYDLWGVPDGDEETLESQFTARSDGLWGVYRFKRGFGGEVRRAAGALDRVYNLPLYRLYLRRVSKGDNEWSRGDASI